MNTAFLSHRLKVTLLVVTFIMFFVAFFSYVPLVENPMPAEAIAVLRNAKSAELLWLGPQQSPQRTVPLDEAHTHAMAKAIFETFNQNDPSSSCLFDPVYAVRITAEAVYDFTLNTDCHQMQITRDKQQIAFIETTSFWSMRTLRGLIKEALGPMPARP